MTTRRSFRRHARREPLSEAQRAFLCHGIGGDAPSTLDEHLGRRGEALRRVWRAYRGELLPQWIQERPGSRPWAWWCCDAPESSRRRLGGIGTPAHEVLAYVEEYDFGVPARWVTAWMVEYYNGRARDVHGQPIGLEYREGSFRGVAINPADPPRFESETTYLKRHRLLGAEERACLSATAFEPETVEPDQQGGANR
jgi:hypothetical protein